MTIGDLLFRLLADGSQLTPSVEKEAQKAGDAGAKTLGQRLSAGLRTNGLRAFGAVAATVFAGATKGALELEQVQARFQAETGASAEEAARAAKVINRVAGDNRLSLEEVAAAAEKVRTDLGLTGDEADAVTAKFAEYARVTRQEAGAAVSAFDDILDNWGLTAADSAGIMDKLVVSHQKFGGVIEEQQKSLAQLAPALRAANFEIDDAIALLNLFGAKGLDAEQGAAAFSKALTKVKSPEELKALIGDISATEDPFLRAQKAADLFGAKAGAKLANALDGVDLESYKVGMEEAAGATDRAAEAADSGFGNRFRKLMSQAGAAVRGLGADFGPAVTGIASIASLSAAVFPGLGSKIAGKIGDGLKASKALPAAMGTAIEALPGAGAVKGAIASAGTKIGTALGISSGAAFTAAFVGAAIAAVAAVKLVADEQQRQIDAIGDDILERSKAFVKVASDPALAQSIRGVREQLDRIPGNAYDARNKVIAVLNTLIEEQNRRAAEIPAAIAEGIDAGAPKLEAAMGRSVLGLRAAAARIPPLVKALGRQIPESIAAGVLEKQNAPVDALNSLRELMKNALTPSAQIARDIGILTSKELAAGLKDKRPAVREEAERVQAVAEADLAKLIQSGGKVGKDAAAELAKKLKSKNAQVRASAERVRDIVNGKIDDIVPAAGRTGATAGRTLMSNFIRSVNSAGVVTIRVRTSDITKGGRALGGPVKAGEPWWVGERGPEIFVPDVNGRVLSHAESVKASVSASPVGGGGGDIVNLTVQGALPVRTIRDVSTELQRVQRLGKVPRKRLAPAYRRKEAGVA